MSNLLIKLLFWTIAYNFREFVIGKIFGMRQRGRGKYSNLVYLKESFIHDKP